MREKHKHISLSDIQRMFQVFGLGFILKDTQNCDGARPMEFISISQEVSSPLWKLNIVTPPTRTSNSKSYIILLSLNSLGLNCGIIDYSNGVFGMTQLSLSQANTILDQSLSKSSLMRLG